LLQRFAVPVAHATTRARNGDFVPVFSLKQEFMAMKLRTCLVAALLVAAPASAALAAPGLVRHSASLRAGPGAGFPAVDRIPAGARVTIHGCLRGGAWCDVSFAGERGWVSAGALDYLYRHRYVALPDYVEDVPVVPFALSSYWANYYVGRPWYHRHAHWNRYWRGHPPGIAHGPQPHGHFAGRPGFGRAPGEAIVGRGPDRHLPPQFAHHHGRPPGGTMAIGHQGTGQPQRFGGMQPHGIGGHFSPGLTARPMAAPQMAQPNTGRPLGSPMGAHAQMGGPRGPVGGMSHAGGAPHVGGGTVGAGAHIGAGPRGSAPGPAR
jgi:uncharacterized protein YraI